MSYIRGTSNPESLYIWADFRGRVHVSHRVSPPLSSGDEFTLPRHVFEHICRAWGRTYGTSRYRGLRIEKLHVYVDDGSRVPINEDIVRMLSCNRPREILMRLSYGKHFLFMWLVTWEHIVANVMARGK